MSRYSTELLSLIKALVIHVRNTVANYPRAEGRLLLRRPTQHDRLADLR